MNYSAAASGGSAGKLASTLFGNYRITPPISKGWELFVAHRSNYLWSLKSHSGMKMDPNCGVYT